MIWAVHLVCGQPIQDAKRHRNLDSIMSSIELSENGVTNEEGLEKVQSPEVKQGAK